MLWTLKQQINRKRNTLAFSISREHVPCKNSKSLSKYFDYLQTQWTLMLTIPVDLHQCSWSVNHSIFFNTSLQLFYCFWLLWSWPAWSFISRWLASIGNNGFWLPMGTIHATNILQGMKTHDQLFKKHVFTPISAILHWNVFQ